MKYVIIGFLIVLMNSNIYSQNNLVPNYSFEVYDTCPNLPGKIYYALPWIDPTHASADYFNSCNLSTFGVPSNYIGTQSGIVGSMGYSGIATFVHSAQNWREYIQVKLDTDLIGNETYCVEFYVSLADTVTMACNTMGMYFSNTAISGTNHQVLNVIPQIQNNTVANPLTDKIGWTSISGSFVASGGERFITIGNFSNDLNSDTIHLAPSINVAYYYIDNVSVFEIKQGNAGRDTTICHGDSVQLGVPTCPGVTYSWQPTNGLSNPNISNPWAKPLIASTTYYLTQTTPCGILLDTVVVSVGNCWAGVNELNRASNYKLYPNPNNGNMTLEYNIKDNQTGLFSIFDMMGKQISSQNFNSNNSSINIDASQLNAGVYYYEVKVEGEKTKADKLVIIK